MSGYFSKLGRRVVDGLDLNASQPRDLYLRRAFYIMLAGAALVAAIWHFGENDGSLGWIALGCVAVAAACGNAVKPIFMTVDGLGADGFGAIIGLVLLPFALLAASPLLLVWNLVQAARAEER